MTGIAAPRLRGPASASERALAPDLARGFMLLMIVLANTPWYLYGQTPGLSTIHPVEGSALAGGCELVVLSGLWRRSIDVAELEPNQIEPGGLLPREIARPGLRADTL